MKAAIRSTYGTPAILRVEEVAKPIPKDNEILVKVHVTTANRTDCHLLTGKPYFMRLFAGFFKPRLATTGTDFAGQVEATGATVTLFKPGDRVIGFNFLGLRSHADYAAVPEKNAILIPGNIPYEEAAACVEGAFYALAVINKIKPKAGQKSMVIGATGAIGSAALQFLKYYDNTVTAVCDGAKFNLVRSLGADKVVDYKTQDFTEDARGYDFVLDAVGKYTFARCKKLLKKKGLFSSSGGRENILLPLITPLLGGKKVVFAPPKDQTASLEFIMSLVEKGKFRPVIDRSYSLDQVAQAFTYVMTGEKTGNVLLTMQA